MSEEPKQKKCISDDDFFLKSHFQVTGFEVFNRELSKSLGFSFVNVSFRCQGIVDI